MITYKAKYLYRQWQFLKNYSRLGESNYQGLSFDEYSVDFVELLELHELISTGCMIIYSNIQDYTISLLNLVNGLANRMHFAKAWHATIDGLSDDEKLYWLQHILEPALENLLGKPYVIQNRAVYGVAMILRSIEEVFYPGDKNDIRERDISLESILGGKSDRLKGKIVDLARKFGIDLSNLQHCLRALNSAEFELKEYRNEYQHRLPPNIEFGSSKFLVRHEGRRGVSYGFGGIEPVPVSEALTILDKEYSNSIKLYKSFREFCCQVRWFVKSIQINSNQ